MALKSLGNRTPHEFVFGRTPDICILTQFHFWQPIYFAINESAPFPDTSNEKLGVFAGFADHVGNACTFQVVDAETGLVLPRLLD